MAETKFNVFNLDLNTYKDSPFKTFGEMLANIPENPTNISREEDEIGLLANPVKKGNLYTGTFFMTLKVNWPATMNSSKEIKDLLLDTDTYPAEFTSFIFDSENNMISIQSNSKGASHNAIMYYFKRNFRIRSTTLNLVINPHDLRTMGKMKRFHSFTFKIARVDNGELFKRKKSSVTEFVSIADKTNTNLMTVTLSMNHDTSGSLNKSTIRSLINVFKKYDEHEVRKVQLTGDDPYDHSKTIDFVLNKASLSIISRNFKNVNLRSITEILNKAVDEYNAIVDDLNSIYKIRVYN